jgi:hypothetical protein
MLNFLFGGCYIKGFSILKSSNPGAEKYTFWGWDMVRRDKERERDELVERKTCTHTHSRRRPHTLMYTHTQTHTHRKREILGTEEDICSI